MERLRTQDEARRIADATTRCYLCGHLLNDRRYGTVNREHIIPKKVLGEAPSPSAWPPILPVHETCNERKNTEGDQAHVVLHKVHRLGAGSVHRREIGMLPSGRVSLQLGDVKTETFDPVDQRHLERAVWTWVRGLHMFLYQTYLPPGLRNEAYFPVLSVWVDEPIDAGLLSAASSLPVDALEEHKFQLLRELHRLWDKHEADAVFAWDRRLQFFVGKMRYSRKNRRKAGVQDKFSYIWALVYPGLENWGPRNTFDAPVWIGWYEPPRTPISRSIPFRF